MNPHVLVSLRIWAVPAVACLLCDALIVLTAIELRGERALQLILGAQLTALLTAAAVLLLLRLGLRRSLAAGSAATALGVAAVAAAPIPVELSDCNTRSGVTYAAAAPFVWLADPPPDTRLVLGGAMTLEECYAEPRSH